MNCIFLHKFIMLFYLIIKSMYRLTIQKLDLKNEQLQSKVFRNAFLFEILMLNILFYVIFINYFY